MSARKILRWRHSGHYSWGDMWTPVYVDAPKKPGKISWMITVIAVVVLIASLTGIGYLSGYAEGFNDNLAAKIAKYRVAKKMR